MKAGAYSRVHWRHDELLNTLIWLEMSENERKWSKIAQKVENGRGKSKMGGIVMGDTRVRIYDLGLQNTLILPRN